MEDETAAVAEQNMNGSVWFNLGWDGAGACNTPEVSGFNCTAEYKERV